MRPILLALLTLVATASPPANAQYYIGGYYYSCPAGAAWNDARCVREPVQDDQVVGEGDAHAAAQSAPETWGSVYIDVSTGALGATVQAKDEAGAEAAAEARCAKGGSLHCERQLTFVNQCVVVAWPNSAGRIATRTGPAVGPITAAALKACGPSGEKCEIAYSGCAKSD